MAEPRTDSGRMRWLTRHIPTRETIHEYRLLRPFAGPLSHPSLWRMSRRSVPRGVAVGLFVAIIMPFMHTVIAALLAIPTRANVAVAAVITLVVNPLTMGPMYYAAYHIGEWELHHEGPFVDPAAAAQMSGELSRLLFWIHHASGAIAVGILTMAVLAAAFGYLAASLVWAAWSRSRWQRRHARRVVEGS